MDVVETWYRNLPVITRAYSTLALLTTLACQFEIVSPYHLYYNFNLIFYEGQVWRLATNFLFFGNLELDFFFHMFFLVHYSSVLEVGSFRGRTADMFFMLLFGATCMLIIAPFVGLFFLGSSLSFMMVYVWGRRNPNSRLNLLQLFTFTAPYLPWVLLGFSCLLGNSPTVDLLGIAVGHVYFFLKDIYPYTSGRDIMKTPRVIKVLFGEGDLEAVEAPQPGGFQFGGAGA